MSKKSFILYQEYEEHISTLSLEQKGELFDAIFSYNKGIEIKLDPVVKMAFSFIKADLNRNNQKYNNIVERNRINGSKGGRPSKPKKPNGLIGNPKKPKEPDNGNDNVNDKEDKKTKAKKACEKMLAEEKKKLIERLFDEFWITYSYKKAKSEAIKAFVKALKAEKAATIIAGAKQYAKYRDTDSQYWKYPATWLNQQCWNDEYKQSGSTSSEPKMSEQERKKWAYTQAAHKLARKFKTRVEDLTKQQLKQIRV